MMPHNLPPWTIVYQRSQRWLQGREDQPTAAFVDSRTLQSTPESGHRAGYDGAKRRKGSKVHLAVDTLGELLALYGTPANAQDRKQSAPARSGPGDDG